mmetsp:Transcript_28388/g.65936  ORF Transcript_28388/g.65936 Transcript_28388/m.65936 type:complete len:716 (-) Transcript_28388:50-2197(-)|eukprot:CAMPEP_0182559884 /NCGR_PEP_ID=MMETSP1324-20130603/2831_1 /TAXON_ID=236786 /ORGANISM="Florenciella sp., Strain RCC1587" /LENGTH=715 /DNA_ID=CAMNT_0024772199 /DNA_START=158 /DNA_END=2305 /DNA_ORIENTATION=+
MTMTVKLTRVSKVMAIMVLGAVWSWSWSSSGGMGMVMAQEDDDDVICSAANYNWTVVGGAASAWRPGDDIPDVHIVMQVTDPIGEYAKYSVAVASLWAQTHDFTMAVHSQLPEGTPEHPTPEGMDHRFGKVALMKEYMEDVHGGSCPAEWLLWLDADVLMTVEYDWTRPLIETYPDSHIIGSRDIGGEGVMNSGVMLVKCSEWSSLFFEQWWTHPLATAGKPDQLALGELIDLPENSEYVTVLSGEAINTAPFWWHSFVPGVSPVLHLINQPKETRRAVGSALLSKLCTAPGADSMDEFEEDGSGSEYMTVNWNWSWEWLATEYVTSLETITGAFGTTEDKEAMIQASKASEFLASYFSEQNPPQHDKALRVLDTSLRYTEKHELGGTALLMARVAETLTALGRYEQADGLFNAAQNQYQHQLKTGLTGPEGTPALYQIIKGRAGAAMANKKGELALELYHTALAGQEKYYGKEHVAVAVTVDEIGTAFAKYGQHAKAAEYFVRAATINDEKLGLHDPTSIVVRCHLAVAYLRSGNPAGDDVLAHAVAETVKLGSPHLARKVSGRLSALATSFENAGGEENSFKALYVHSLVTEVIEAGFGKVSAEFATAVGNMATTLVGGDKVRDALLLFESALEVDREVYGEEDLAVATDHFNIGYVQSKLGMFTEAAESFDNSAAIRAAKLPMGEAAEEVVQARSRAAKARKAGGAASKMEL